jgi:hypothetical protein
VDPEFVLMLVGDDGAIPLLELDVIEEELVVVVRERSIGFDVDFGKYEPGAAQHELQLFEELVDVVLDELWAPELCWWSVFALTMSCV